MKSALEPGDFIFLLFPCRKYSAQLLFEGDFDSAGKSLTIRSESFFDGAVAVEVQDVESTVLLHRHRPKANEIDQDNCTLRLTFD
jgi:hypothetical protein